MEPNNLNKMALESFDYTIIVDRSGSMGSIYKSGKTRYEFLKESLVSFSNKLAKYDKDGFDLYTFSNKFQKYSGINSSAKVVEVFDSKDPNGSTDLYGVLEDFFKNFNATKSDKPHMCIVFTDGEPDDKTSVAKSIVGQTKKLDADEQLTLLFIQIGDDASATKFLVGLDNDLTSYGAKFDIVDVKTIENSGDYDDLSDLLLEAVID